MARKVNKGVITTDSVNETTDQREEREQADRDRAVEENDSVQVHDDPLLAHRQRTLYGTLDSNESRKTK